MSRNQGARRAPGHPISINGILNDAMIAVAQIQNISDIDKAPPYISPNTPLVNPRTGERIPPTGASSSASAARQPGTLINIVNSQNVQIGHYNRMYFQTGRQQNQEVEEDSSSDSDNFDNEEDLQEQVRQRRLADEETAEILRDSHRQVSDDELQRLSRYVGGSWRRLFRLMEIEESDVDYIFHIHQSDGLEEVIYQLLKKWKIENNNPTVGDLIAVLEKAEMGRLLKHLKT
ncbi:receptor-interacting serine/threonine-protein kinase 1-like isoform X2 [Haliotis cracherodii]|uniref:receptor-interacting serine/threonine-protein kinase 1-like isoform X2 n=1 Tax=Haliotis cracherodii TaxID=6455 RepID=UPI0039ED0AC4